MSNSHEIVKEFNEKKKNKELEVEFFILNSAFWPMTAPMQPLKLP